MNNDHKPNNLVEILKTLPANGRRLKGGLALRITRGNGMAVLGCSRIGVPPSLVEMRTIATAVRDAFDPPCLFGDSTISLHTDKQGNLHHIQRLYWPLNDVSLVWSPPVQQPLLDAS